jgi:hypothetical protein
LDYAAPYFQWPSRNYNTSHLSVLGATKGISKESCSSYQILLPWFWNS